MEFRGACTIDYMERIGFNGCQSLCLIIPFNQQHRIFEHKKVLLFNVKVPHLENLIQSTLTLARLHFNRNLTPSSSHNCHEIRNILPARPKSLKKKNSTNPTTHKNIRFSAAGTKQVACTEQARGGDWVAYFMCIR